MVLLAADHADVVVRSDVDQTWLETDFRSAVGLIGLLEAPDPRTRFTVAKVALEYADQVWPDSEDRPRGEADRAEIRRVLAGVSGWGPREWSPTEAYVVCVLVKHRPFIEAVDAIRQVDLKIDAVGLLA